MPKHLSREQPGSPKGGRDAQAFMTGGEQHARPLGVWTDQRQAVRRGGTKAGPDPDTLEPCEVRKILKRARDHPAQDVMVHVAAMIVELP